MCALKNRNFITYICSVVILVLGCINLTVLYNIKNPHKREGFPLSIIIWLGLVREFYS